MHSPPSAAWRRAVETVCYEMNEPLTVTVQDLAYGGDGVAKTPDGRVVFVPFTIPGEEVDIEIVSTRKNLARAKLLAIRQASPERVEPHCPYYGRCGGCQYQHLAYARQVDGKGRQLQAALTRLGKLAVLPPINPTIPSPNTYGYRNKLTLEPFIDGDGQLEYGFFSHVESGFIGIDACPLAHPEINALIPAAKQAAQARAAAGDQRTAPAKLLFRRPAGGGASFHVGQPHPRIDWLAEEVAGRTVRVPPAAFWQINPAVANLLATTASGWLTAANPEQLVETYAGIGVFSLALGKTIKQVWLIESDRLALTAARWNHQHYGLPGRQFVRAAAEKALPEILEALGAKRQRTVVLLDPPREGCAAAVIAALAARPVAAVLYISCNPTTLARDLQSLCGSGGPYRLGRLAMADMFPQTAHFETAAWLERVSTAG